ncbi:MAG: hypothetical protein H0W43_04215 [Chthoniobacterales bacterium]|nr:hypothetical protein [Chthoniobacterales bacterium]
MVRDGAKEKGVDAFKHRPLCFFPKLAASGQQPMAVLEGVAAGLTLEIIAQAVNGPAQSVASNPILMTMPSASATAESATDAELAALLAVGTNGNANANGIGNGAELTASRH